MSLRTFKEKSSRFVFLAMLGADYGSAPQHITSPSLGLRHGGDDLVMDMWIGQQS
jgi:hypothetical protein